MAHHIFCIMGKSGSGKDSIYRVLIQDESLGLNTVVTYTTRPRREKVQEGREFHFCTDEAYTDHLTKGRIIEERAYDTCYGIWRYFTLDDGQIDPDAGDYLIIGTPESFASFCRYYGRDRVVPLYIEVEDGVRLSRALVREKKQIKPAYDEMCRRFLADRDDFSEDKLRAAGINRRFDNSTDVRETCINEIKSYIREFTD